MSHSVNWTLHLRYVVNRMSDLVNGSIVFSINWMSCKFRCVEFSNRMSDLINRITNLILLLFSSQL